MKTITIHAMGSKILIAADSHDPSVFSEIEKAEGWFEEWEQSLSRFRLNSELSVLNRHPGVAIKVSDTLFRVLTASLEAEKLSGGLVTPAILPDLLASGYSMDFDELTSRDGWALRQNPIGPMPADPIKFNRRARTVTLPYGTQLDFGGIAKGWAAHQTMTRLSHFSPVLVDAGGDIAISGPRSDGSDWPIGVANPFETGNILELVMVSRGGLATSGRDYRRWKFNNMWQHHIIDPRTRHPADTDVLTATVLAHDVVLAEAYAKTALILGSIEGSQWLDQHEDIQYLLILENGIVVKNPGFLQKQWNELCLQNSMNQ
jgi:thiamine biosynthesis lipoprotein